MKFSTAATILFALAPTASAFIPQQTSNSFSSIRNQVETENEVQAPTDGEKVISEPEPAEEITSSVPKGMSPSLPFMERPAMLDGTMAGDVGFDPVGFAKTKEDLMNYREAEIKHARLAMLAAAGWPLSELFDKPIANTVGIQPVLDASDRAPSVLNGGLAKISPIYWAACLIAAGAIDVYGITKARKNEPGYFPGNLGFDPLGFYPDTPQEQMDMQLKEIKNGRLAMIAITAFAVQEFVQKIGVVDETPVFFKPFGTVIREYANSGYIIPDNVQ